MLIHSQRLSITPHCLAKKTHIPYLAFPEFHGNNLTYFSSHISSSYILECKFLEARVYVYGIQPIMFSDGSQIDISPTELSLCLFQADNYLPASVYVHIIYL